MPPSPSGSFLADGFDTTSTLATMFAGSWARKVPSCCPRIGETRPLICTTTFGLPRSDTLLSPSTSTAGTLRSTSTAVPPVVAGMSFTA